MTRFGFGAVLFVAMLTFILGAAAGPIAAQEAATPISEVQDAPTATPEPSPTPQPTPTTTSGPRAKSSSIESTSVQPAALGTLTMTLALSPVSPIAAGTSQTAQASWSAIGASKPTGTVTYTVFTGTGCTGATFAAAGTMTVSSLGLFGSVAASNAVIFPSAGSYSWQAAYSGDVNYNASTACAALTVNKASPTLTLMTTPVSPITAGASVAAAATLASASSIAGGTVAYTVYSNNTCSTAYAITGSPSTVTVTNGAVPNSTALVFNTAGTYYWKAVYSGDTNDNGASSACLTLTVNKTSPTLTLGLVASTITVGTTATGTATLSGATSIASGTVTYTVYSNSTCTTLYSVSGSPSAQTVTNGAVPNSTAITFNTPGTYYWKASYGGDVGNNSAASACLTLTVAPTNPTVGLTTNPAGSVVTGGSATATATLTGATATAGGTVVYTVYTDSACTSVYTATNNPSTKTVLSGVPAASSSVTIAIVPPGPIYWRAVYSGDANNNTGTSPCVALNVARLSPSVSLSVSATKNPMRAGGSATGKATLSGATSTAGGTITYTVYTNSACTTVLAAANNPSTKTVTAAVAATSAAITFNSLGTFYWQAVYSGDASNNGAASSCVAFSVGRANPSISLSVTASTLPMTIGGTAFGKITMTKSSNTAGGTLTYTVYTDSSCTGVYSTANNPSTVTVTNKTVPNSALITVNLIGTVYWKAVYSGDANDNGATSRCVPLVVNKATPALTLTTAATNPPMTAGGTAIGQVAITRSSASAGGSLTYTVYSDSTCATALTAAGSPSTVTVANAVAPNSAPITISSVGTVYWRAVYAGDAQNAAATSACVSLAVAKTTPSSVLKITPAVSPMVAGGTATGAVTLSNATADASGTMIYTVYTTNACTTPVSPALTSTKTVTNNVVPVSDPLTFAAAGTYYWQAVYSGDLKNGSVTSACVGFTVAAFASSTLSLSLAPNPVTAGNTVIGSANLAGTTPGAGGTVTYTVYSDAACATPVSPAQSSTVTVVNANPPNSAPLLFSVAGTVYWRAVYGGDANNSSAASPCTALVVNKTAPALGLAMSPNPVEAGASSTGAATLTGAINSPGGTVVYTVYTNNACTTQINPALTSTKTVVNGTVPNSTAFAITTAGTFYWKAVYSGDASNGAASSACAALIVSKSTPDLSLTQTPLPVNVGDNFTVHASLSGDAVNPTGASTLSYYSDPDCTLAMSGLTTYTATLANGQIPDAPSFVFNYPDGLFLQATYSGDANNAGNVSDCVETVIAQDLPLSLALSPSDTIARGASAFAQASWPIDEDPTGTVTYSAYASATCTGTALAGPESKAIAANAVGASSAVVFANAGVYSWKATYSGDSAYNPTSTCTALTVTKTTPTVSLTMTPNPVLVGQRASGAATLSSGTSGSVTYTVYVDNSCSTQVSPAKQSVKTVTNGIAPASDAFTFATSGTFYWQAVYSGDANTNAASSPCAIFTVSSSASTLSMSQSPSAVAIASAFTVHFALGADAVNPTGTVTLTRYTDSACANPVAGLSPAVMTLANGQIPDAPPLTYAFSGPIYQKAAYSGDTNNGPATTACVAVALSPGALTASASDASLTPIAYSNNASTSTGQIVIVVSDLRATWAGWSVTMISSNFAYTGVSPRGAAITAGHFSVSAAPSAAVLAGQAIGSGGPSAAPAATGSLSQTRTLVSAASGFGSGSYQISVPAALVIPAQSQAGSYTATITIAVSAAP